MHHPRALAVTIAAAGLIGGTFITATPAFAATIPVTASCTAGEFTFDHNNFGTSVGDIIVVTNTSAAGMGRGANTGIIAINSGAGENWTVPGGESRNFEVNSASGGSINFVWDGLGSGPCTAASGTLLTFTGGGYTPSGGGSSEATSVESATPPPVVQQFGKPVSGTCDAAAPTTLNWAGVPSGGWGESWSQWMNGGTGGFVCSRTLVYSNSVGGWGLG